MKPATRRLYVAGALVLAIGALLGLALVQPILGSRTDFSIYNTGWAGASTAARQAGGVSGALAGFSVSTGDEVGVSHLSLAQVDLDPARGSLLVLGPEDPPTARERAWLSAFVREGGRLLVADDYGEGNAFLEAAGAQTRFDGGQLASLAFTRQPPFVVTTNVSEAPETEDVSAVVLDYATPLEATDNATVLAAAGPESWIDGDANGRPDDDEPRGPFPLLVRERVGEGTVVVLGDPSVAVNGMQDVADDGQLTANLVAWLAGEGRRVVVDETHHGQANPVRFLGARLAPLSPPVRALLGGLAGVVFLAFVLGDPERRARTALSRARALVRAQLPESETTEGDPVARVLQRHPGWSQSDLRDIVRSWREGNGPGGDR